ncbi:queuosine precursor transporter [Allosphingosinicella flava]|uniref:Probable queuosine precursor transporter n=1 Tax=Allosphingosinicella flava TaxID=2771430 RepID=A0A7T2GI90_9SPHN|nr:queuosine precursor transporter [Sphingosinicella flava]QPQ54321.1 queuosine precursor transporter [Sphingosinicella flava]
MTTATTSGQSGISRSLFILSIFYGGMTCIAGVLGNKLVALGPLAVEAGIFAFLLLVVTSSAIAETKGRETANKLVLYGFIPLITSMILIRLVLALPPAAFWEEERRVAFDLILNQSARLMLGGMIAYGTSQILNVFIFTKMKRAEGGLLWLRGLVAGVLSQAVDTVIFIFIAFYGVAPVELILPGQLLAKVVLSAILVPPLIYAFVALVKRLDK